MKPMKIYAIYALIALSLSVVLFASRSAASKPKPIPGNAKNGFAVLELFTSEGCSSCPPAEELLAHVQQENANRQVYVLAYHVDYWNRLGWKDVFSKPEYSKRQYQYCSRFAGQVYTPQLIINGKSECLGSDASAVNEAINDGLNASNNVSLTLHAQQNGNVDYTITGDAERSQLIIAIVQKHAVSKVERGENAGLTLSHAQIVTDLQAFNLKPNNKGTEQLRLPAGCNANDWELIGMLQDPASGVISAVTRAIF